MLDGLAKIMYITGVRVRSHLSTSTEIVGEHVTRDELHCHNVTVRT